MPRPEFDEVYRANVQPIYRYCLFRTNDPHDAEDLTEEVFVRYLQHAATVRGARVVPWLYRVAHNLCVDAHERMRVHARAVNGMEVRVSEPAPWHDPAVWQALRTLAAEQQQVLYLKAIEDRTFKEIARLTGRGESAVKMSYYRGAKTLADKLGGADR
jgi:RNA polymerase sigma-70 factor, ECF subfamily